MRWTFSLRSKFSWTTFVAVIAALFRLSVGLGIIVAIVGVPAAIRGALIIARRSAFGPRLTPAERTNIFISSFSYVMIFGMFFVLGAVGFGMLASLPVLLFARGRQWLSAAGPAFVGIASLAGGLYSSYQTVRDWED